MRIGIVGSGRIGGTVARLAIAQGHDVVLSNSRGPETLSDLVAQLGPHVSAASVSDAAASADVILVAIPVRANRELPVELDSGETTSSELLAAHLPTARVVKMFNTIEASQLGSHGQPAGSDNRRALPLAGDDAEAKKVVTELIDSFGFDVVDAGPLAEGRRFEPNTPAYGPRLTADELQSALAEVR